MRTVRLILRCYPKAWRARYEAEILDVAASEGASVRLVLDLLAGALDARLHPELVPPAGDRGPAIYDERDLLRSPYRQPFQVSFLGVLSWSGWTALGLQAITTLYWLLAIPGLIPVDLRHADPGAWNGLVWLQLFSAPLVGNLIVRGFVHSARDRTRARLAR